ncbi:hypothetical protein GpartN1_g959.t1 [Galdieria partita]|uniref:Zinc-ribbon domain-containing protein n=1 Tax=Galdieria partita TaxID=83374 RepID=A0A9C7PR12_9RHOD|nr:hypothetical protein GpartN1_g959.t1 [Galdieria partita]
MVILFVVHYSSFRKESCFIPSTNTCQRCQRRNTFIQYHTKFSRRIGDCTRAAFRLEEPKSFQSFAMDSQTVFSDAAANVLELPCGAKRLENAPCGDGANCPFIKYQCKRGHIVKALKGSPVCKDCPLCKYEAEAELCPELRRGSTKPLSLATMQRIASRRGGLCLSTSYKSVRDKFLWRCSEGHEWYASGDNVRRGSWCPTCARKTQSLDLSELNELAKEKGGRCLSTIYKNVHQKLKWECSQGHIFMMNANNIRRRSNSSRPPSWCPICANLKRSEKRKKSTAVDKTLFTAQSPTSILL